MVQTCMGRIEGKGGDYRMKKGPRSSMSGLGYESRGEVSPGPAFNVTYSIQLFTETVHETD